MTASVAGSERAIDDLSNAEPAAPNGCRWEAVSDRVMGGVSVPALARGTVAGRPAQRLTGRVRLDNDGGFLQMALDLAPGRAPVDAIGREFEADLALGWIGFYRAGA